MAKSTISVGNKGIYFYSISSEFDMISLLIQLIKPDLLIKAANESVAWRKTIPVQ